VWDSGPITFIYTWTSIFPNTIKISCISIHKRKMDDLIKMYQINEILWNDFRDEKFINWKLQHWVKKLRRHKWQDVPSSWIRRFNIAQISVVPKVSSLIKIHIYIYRKIIWKYIGNGKRPRRVNVILRKTNLEASHLLIRKYTTVI
jgi:hypothetical protein